MRFTLWAVAVLLLAMTGFALHTWFWLAIAGLVFIVPILRDVRARHKMGQARISVRRS